ncbi:MAG TPA: serine O-acetyltransferase [Oscillospiraceae bacterium]|nr:serine O-acetyltransferase [Oscillospiraceae bacterium]HPK34901.1 serine O-acetyltransferase [Oscillospiraceae bacterium]HPR76909.1 serine O-acetyltransferase [Oscillospiraceae bacterium]
MSCKYDIERIMDCDPAAVSAAQVFFLYSGFRAVRRHRVAHWLYEHKFRFLAFWYAKTTRRRTGIEIHPAAKIGKGLFIDHGMGVVIGETAEIGDNCTLYQGVTLGGTGKHTGKRHPTLGDNVMVGAGAKVLGPFKVGNNSKIAAGAVVLEEIPENCTAVGVPARVVSRNGERVVQDLDQIHIPDPVAQELCRLQMEIDNIKKELKTT